jgi:hypothetical protein
MLIEGMAADVVGLTMTVRNWKQALSSVPAVQTGPFTKP